MKKTIIAIVGSSGSGKTTLSLYMNNVYGIPYICSYTTRPMRDGETDGIEHIFVTDKDVPDKSEMLAYTVFGGYQYWALKTQVKEIVTYVIDEKGLFYLLDNFKDQYNIITVYVQRDNIDGVDETRKNRDTDRISINEADYDLILVNNYPDKDLMCKHCSEHILNYIETFKSKDNASNE